VEAIISLRTQAVGALRRQGWSIPSAQGNFVWLQTGSHTKAAAEEFRAAGMLVRAFADDGIRITIAERESILPLLATAQTVRDVMTITRPSVDQEAEMRR
jgi:histidinol-phosphate aminotransferase